MNPKANHISDFPREVTRAFPEEGYPWREAPDSMDASGEPSDEQKKLMNELRKLLEDVQRELKELQEKADNAATPVGRHPADFCEPEMLLPQHIDLEQWLESVIIYHIRDGTAGDSSPPHLRPCAVVFFCSFIS